MLALLLALSARAEEPMTASTERLEDTWNLGDLYPSLDAWEADMVATTARVDALAKCQGRLAKELGDCVGQRFEAQKAVAKLYTYASNASAQDIRDSEWLGRSQRAELLWVRLGEKASFFEPELIALGEARVLKVVARDDTLAPYAYYLRRTFQDAAHTLDAQGEAMLAASAGIRGAASRLHDLLVDAELPWPSVTLADGSTVAMNHAAWTEHRDSSDRAHRRAATGAFFGGLQAFEGTLGAMLDTAIQGHWMVAQARRYPTCVAGALNRNHLPPEVYDTLVRETRANLPTLHRYLRLRARLLGLEDLDYSDTYPPLVALDRRFGIDESKAIVLESVAPLGPEYQAAMAKAFEGRWMDVYPRPGKSSGAYVDGGAYEAHPYMLLNHTGNYESLTTFAHEWGHAMHSVLASEAQPYATADYATFIAEIASTANEALLLETLLDRAESDDERLFYLGQALESLRGTYFRQAQFAEFELAIHAQVERGEPLTGKGLSTLYRGILEDYYGHAEGVTLIADRDAIEWAFIGHFYYDFYVFQYATSIAAASLFADDILAGKPGAVERYLSLLKAGGSDDPHVLLSKAGVDMTRAEPYQAVAQRMERIMDEMEAILSARATGP